MALREALPEGQPYLGTDLLGREPGVRVLDLNQGPLPDAEADLVVALAVLEYLHEIPTLLRNARRRAGRLVLSYPPSDGQAIRRRLHQGWFNHLSRAELRATLAACGWTIAGEAEHGDCVLYRCTAGTGAAPAAAPRAGPERDPRPGGGARGAPARLSAGGTVGRSRHRGARVLVYAAGPAAKQKLDAMVVLMPPERWRDPGRPVVQIAAPWRFLAGEPVWMTQRPPFHHYRDPPLPGTVIGGRFPVDVWPRTLMWAFEWHDLSRELVLERGEPWFYLRFEARDPGRPVRLVEVRMTPELREYRRASTA